MTPFRANNGRPFLAYGASKPPLNHLSKTSTAVLGAEGIATTALCPSGFVSHGMSTPCWPSSPPSKLATPTTFAADRPAVAIAGGEHAEVADVALWIAASADAANGVVWSTTYCSAL